MTKFRKYFFFLCLLVIGFSVGYTTDSLFDKFSEKKSMKKSYWQEDPVLINCIGLLIEEDRIKKAISYWDEKGEKVSFYHYNYQKNACENKNVSGFILLKSESGLLNDKQVLAKTKRYMIKDKIIRAEVYFKPGTYNYSMLLEHELGHAFGYKHKLIPGNIMNPSYDLIGPRF